MRESNWQWMIPVLWICNILIIFMTWYFLPYSFFNVSFCMTFQLICNLTLLKTTSLNIISLPSLSMIATFIFHIGQFFTFAFNEKPVIPGHSITSVSDEISKSTLLFYFFSQLFFTLGVYLFNQFCMKYSVEKPEIDLIDERWKNHLELIPRILIYIGIIPFSIITFMRLSLFIEGNYLDTYQLSLSGYLYTLADLMMIGIVLLVTEVRNKKRTDIILCSYYILLSIINFIMGHRIQSVLFVFLLFYVWAVIQKRFSRKHYVFLVFLSFIALVSIAMVRKLRLLDNVSFSEITKVFFDTISTNLILDSLSEFGGTFVSLAYAIMFFNSKTGFFVSRSYLFSLLFVFPNVGGFQNDLMKFVSYTSNFPDKYSYAIGGSYLGEAYANFGMVGGVVFIGVVGFIIAALYAKQLKSYNNNLYYYTISLLLVVEILAWIRGYFVDSVRVITIGAFVVFFVYYLNEKLKRGVI